MQIRKTILLCLLSLLVAAQLPAQTNTSPARLAIVGESPEAATMVDVLTAEFSKDDRVQVLERAEIEKVIHEQQLSLNNLDGLKLGRLLGADGVLFLAPAQWTTNGFTGVRFESLDTRLVAVKPGVVLAAERFSNPEKDLTGWASHYADNLRPYVDKLGALGKDAMPVSVVNFRSAVAVSDAAATERQLQTLAVERLSREPRLFVLERQKMQQLTGEKDLSADETAFWNGAWLLEGVIDQNGFSKETITLNARLTPAKGGTAILLEASGSRKNFAEVIDQLTAKVMAALQINTAVKQLSPEDEAAQFFSEAQWAMSWGELKEAHAAAEAAWALGKRDEACATLRIRPLITGLKPAIVAERGNMGVNTITNTPPGWVAADLREVSKKHLAVFITTNRQGIAWISLDADTNQPVDDVVQALEAYQEFSRNAPQGLAKSLEANKDNWRNPGWYKLGLDSLEAASKILENYNLEPELAEPLAGKLADLRAAARGVADLMIESPPLHDSYFVGDRTLTFDELGKMPGDWQDIYSCLLKRGCYWQERPEDTIELYRKLMGSPAYHHIRAGLWHRENWPPRLVAWNDEGRVGIPRIWNGFIRELDGSTNLALQFEGRALQMADIEDDEEMAVAFTNFFSGIISNRSEIVTNPVVTLCAVNWDAEELSKDPNGSDVYSEIRDRLPRVFSSTFAPQLQAIENECREYQKKIDDAAKWSVTFERQKKYLQGNDYDFTKLMDVFREKSWSPAQAQELLPLIIAYKSNLLAAAGSTNGLRQFELKNSPKQIEFFLQRDVENALHPQTQPAWHPPAVVEAPPRPAVPLKPENGLDQSGAITNIISVDKFLAIPLDVFSNREIMGLECVAHNLAEGKLLLDFQLTMPVFSYDKDGNWQSTRNATIPAIAVLDLASEHWQVIPCPETPILSQNNFYQRTTFWRGQVYTSDGNKVRRFDVATNGWQDVDLPDVGNCELFNVNGHLYAANYNMIVEILGNGDTHILVSNRRQPPVCALDTADLGTPVLFPGPNGTVRAALREKTYSWDGSNWADIYPTPVNSLPAIVTDEAALFFGDGENTSAGIWRLPFDADRVDFCMGQSRDGRDLAGSAPGSKDKPKPRWDYSEKLPLARLAVANRGSDIYLLAGRARFENIVDEHLHMVIGHKVLPQDGYHAQLFCYSTNCPVPQKIFLKFDATDMTVPVGDDSSPHGFFFGGPASWMLASNDRLFFGRETRERIGAGNGSYHANPGIWMTSFSRIDAEMERQKKIQLVQLAQASAANESAARAVLARYDWNHDGVISGEEKEAALTNRDYVALQLDQIDTNANDVLDPAELKFFDANTNNILDRNEQKGVEITQRLLAERLVRRFDEDGNGLLDRREFDKALHSCIDREFLNFIGNPFPDENHDGFMDVDEVTDFLEAQTERELPGSRGSNRDFKSLVENYWQTGGKPFPRVFHGSMSPPPFMRPPSSLPSQSSQ